MTNSLVHLGTIFTVHGVRGAVKVKSFTEDPAALISYSPLLSSDGKREFVLKLQAVTPPDVLIVHVEGVTDRNAAETLKGTELYVSRDQLPEAEEGEYYHHDLIGMQVQLPNGQSFGSVVAMHNFGAGDIIEIKLPNGKEEMFSFDEESVELVDLEKQLITFNPPDHVYLNDGGEIKE